MTPNRVNLDSKKQHYLFLFLSVFFILLSFSGIYMIFSLTRPVSQNYDDLTPAPTQPLAPTLTPNDTQTPAVSAKPSAGRSTSPKPTSTPKPTATPTPSSYTYKNDSDKFTAVYSSNRTLYIDPEASGNRYTFYRPDSSIAIHVGSDWSWIHPGRRFSGDFLVNGLNTFRYDITDQTIVDLEINGLKYTIQCLHHNRSDLKTECWQFLQDFRTL